MKRVYDVSHVADGTYYPVGAETSNKAILSYMSETGQDSWEYINYRASLARDINNKPICTENTGLLFMEELMPKGYKTWWSCSECGESNCFEYFKSDQYKCKECENIDSIPFAD